MKAVVHLIAGARPNFMKVAPLFHALSDTDWASPIFVHTGQHYDHEMSGTFLVDLGLPEPHFHLGVGSGTQAEQTAGIMVAYERLCVEQPPDWVVVVGDTNSTLACALVAKKCCLPLAHLEAGLRSRNREMPEEINRLATDAISDLLWTPSTDADENLRHEGVDESRIECVGNIMIDAYVMLKKRIDVAPLPAGLAGLSDGYGVVTLHRPSNVDDREQLTRIIEALVAISARIPLVFPVHPRTAARIKQFGMEDLLASGRIHVIKPLSYIEFMALLGRTKFALTDSGGIQEEATYLRVPCLTLRKETERPITLTLGSNRLLEISDIGAGVDDVLSGRHRCAGPPPLWDGKTAARVSASLRRQVARG